MSAVIVVGDDSEKHLNRFYIENPSEKEEQKERVGNEKNI
jgi:hypothetical protein